MENITYTIQDDEDNNKNTNNTNNMNEYFENNNDIKYYNELHHLFIQIYNEENDFSKNIKIIIPDANLITQNNKTFEEYKINTIDLSIEDLLYLANKLLIYIEQLIFEIERILSFNKKYTQIIEELKPILDKF